MRQNSSASHLLLAWTIATVIVCGTVFINLGQPLSPSSSPSSSEADGASLLLNLLQTPAFSLLHDQQPVCLPERLHKHNCDIKWSWSWSWCWLWSWWWCMTFSLPEWLHNPEMVMHNHNDCWSWWWFCFVHSIFFTLYNNCVHCNSLLSETTKLMKHRMW